jgi:CDP-diacylglycerol pyrophosphatase
VKLKRIESLMVNCGSICINPEPITKIKKALKSRADNEVHQGQNCIKLKVYSQLKVQLKEIKSRTTKLNFGQTPKLKP